MMLHFQWLIFKEREQPQLQRTSAAFSVGYPTREARGGSTYMKQNASFSVGMEPLWQPKKAAFSVDQKHQTWGKDFEKEISHGDKEKRSGIDEECEKFGRMFRKKLQEFAMILIKKYHYNFPAEYFDDYRESLNKDKFLKIESLKEKLRRREAVSLLTSNVEQKKYTGLGEIDKEDANSLPSLANAWAEGFGSVSDKKFVGNGIALDQENLTEGPSTYTDIGVEILPPILDLPKVKDSLAWHKMGSKKVERVEEYMEEEDEEEELENDSLSSTLTSAKTLDSIDFWK